jgi:hypothetical protein
MGDALDVALIPDMPDMPLVAATVGCFHDVSHAVIVVISGL